MKKTVALAMVLFCAAMLLASCGKNVAGAYSSDEGYVLILGKDKVWAMKGAAGPGKYNGTYVVDGNKITFTVLESEISYGLTEATIEGDTLKAKGFDKPFVKSKK